MYRLKFKILITLATIFAVAPIWAGDNDLNCSLALDRDKLLVGPKQTAVLKVTLAAPELVINAHRSPVNIGIVLDTSGSMRGTKLAKAKEGAIEALRRLGSEDRFSVVTYSDSARVLVAASKGGEVGNGIQAIGNLRAGGSTALFAGVSNGAAEMRKFMESHKIHRLILLSDGMANVGPDSPEDLGRLGMALSKEDIAVATVGLGDDYNEDLMTRLSQSSEGNTYYVENSNDLPRIFQKELGDVLNVYAQKVEIRLDFPANVRPLAVLGREGHISRQKVTVPLKQIYGGQEKYVLVEVEVLDAKAGESRELARAEVNYLPVDSKAAKVALAQVIVPFTERKEEVLASTNIAVQRDYRLMENTASVDKALDLAKEGKNKEAAKELIISAEKLEQTAEQNNDDLLRDRANEMKEYAAEIENKTLDKKRRKKLKTGNYQQRIQQTPQVDPKAKTKKPIDKKKPKKKEKPEKDN